MLRQNAMSDNVYSRYNRAESVRSRYFYPNCDVFKNKLHIKDEAGLKAVEEDITVHRLIELIAKPLNGRFGITHLLNIHRHIFQDIYPFAGKLREEDIWKGDTFFFKCQFIRQGLEDILGKLKNDNYLSKLDAKDFSRRAAFFMAELNMIHPFREGNGRAIREFIRCLGFNKLGLRGQQRIAQCINYFRK